MYSSFTSIQRKLYDKIVKLKKTAQFGEVAGVTVDRRNGKMKITF